MHALHVYSIGPTLSDCGDIAAQLVHLILDIRKDVCGFEFGEDL